MRRIARGPDFFASSPNSLSLLDSFVPSNGPKGRLLLFNMVSPSDKNRDTTKEPVQDLRSFSVPKGFRGRSAFMVQLWWMIEATVFRLSPQFLYGWRRFLLRLFGAEVGKGVLIRPTASITYPWKLRIGDWSWVGDDVVLYSLGEIKIGTNCVISQRSYICGGTHNYTKQSFDIMAKPVTIEDECWVASDVFVGPGVRIGRGAVVGARSTVVRDIGEMEICVGNPPRQIGHRRQLY